MANHRQKYIHKLTHLRQGVTAYGPAPHKPVLLLAVFQGLEEGWIIGNRIELSPELVGAFKSIWNSVVITGCSPLIAPAEWKELLWAPADIQISENLLKKGVVV